MLRRWISDIHASISKPKGWQFLTKIVAGCFAIISVLEGLRTYHEAHLSRERDQADRSYQEVITQLGNGSGVVRAGAIQVIPDLMRRRVAVEEQITMSRLISILLGSGVRREPIYREPLQLLIRNLLQDPRQRSTVIEMEALVASLEELGARGWYDSQAEPEIVPHRRLAWIWTAEMNKLVCKESPADLHSQRARSLCSRHLMQRAQLPNINLSGMSLTEADFRSSNLTESNLREADLSRARLDGANIKGAQLIAVSLINASLVRTNLSEASGSLANLSGADLREAQINNADFRGAIFERASLSGASLENARIASANFRNANLGDSNLAGIRAVTANFTGANFSHAILDNSDLSDSDLAKVLGWNKIRSMRRAIITGARNLSPEQIAFAISKGAILPQKEKK